MLSLLVGGADDNLLQEGQRSVDVVGLAHRDSLCTRLFCALVTGKIDKVEFGGDDLL